MRITVDTSDFKKLKQEFQKLKARAIPYAARNALNGQAFELQKRWRGEVKSTFTNRNKFTERSIQVDKAKGLDVTTMHAVTGSVAHYMGDQESGAVIRAKSKHKPIPGPAAAGLSPGSKRTKLVRARFRLSAIGVSHPSLAGMGRRRQNAVAIAVAIRRKERFALLNRSKGKGRGIFEIRPLKRSAKVRLLYNLSKSSVRVKPEPTMHRSVQASRNAFIRIAQQALLDQLRRQRAFGH